MYLVSAECVSVPTLPKDSGELRSLKNYTETGGNDTFFRSDWREDVVFSWLRWGGNRSPESIEGNAEGVRIPRR